MEHTESTRQLKVAKELQKDLAEIIRSKGMAAFDGAMVTVSGVRISPDLSDKPGPVCSQGICQRLPVLQG